MLPSAGQISTHTLTWSVTFKSCKMLNTSRFQLTRSRGAWRRLIIINIYKINFNSHAHVERDSTPVLIILQVFAFQLTRSRGAWLYKKSCNVAIRKFQLTRSRGAWPSSSVGSSSVSVISTHTLTWSVTGSLTAPHTKIGFQLTRSRGAWRYTNCNVRYWRNNISTHTLTWSVTCFLFLSVFHFKFQLTRSRGAWPAWCVTLIRELHFNSHAHVERDAEDNNAEWMDWNFNSHAHVERDDKRPKQTRY